MVLRGARHQIHSTDLSRSCLRNKMFCATLIYHMYRLNDRSSYWSKKASKNCATYQKNVQERRRRTRSTLITRFLLPSTSRLKNIYVTKIEFTKVTSWGAWSTSWPGLPPPLWHHVCISIIIIFWTGEKSWCNLKKKCESSRRDKRRGRLH